MEDPPFTRGAGYWLLHSFIRSLYAALLMPSLCFVPSLIDLQFVRAFANRFLPFLVGCAKDFE